MPAIKSFYAKSATEIRDDYLRTYKNGLIAKGVANPQVGPGTEIFLRATAIGNELAVVSANNIVSNDEQMPDTAVTLLPRIMSIFKVYPQPAGGSIGPIVLDSSAPSPVVTGAQLTDSLGQRFEVIAGGVYNPGDIIQIQATAGVVGASTNHAQGDVLQWASAPPFANTKVVVGPGGLVNGTDQEQTESARRRLLDRMQTPSGSGNWSYLVQCSEDSSPRIQKCFWYPAIQGPATTDGAVVAAPTATNKSRSVTDLVVQNTVLPYVRGLNGEHAKITITSTLDVPLDIAFAMTLPEAKNAAPPGDGTGWVNGNVWPRPDGVTTFRTRVTAVTSSTVFTVDAVEAPTVGVSAVAWLSPFNDWRVYTGLVTAASGSAGAWTITVDAPFVGIAVGCYIFPDCQNVGPYMDAIVAAFAVMGPGEKSANVSALAFGFRHPPPATSWKSSAGAHLLRALDGAGTEVEGPSFFHRTVTWPDGTSTTLTGNGGIIVPQPPVVIGAPPRIFIPRHIGLYRTPT